MRHGDGWFRVVMPGASLLAPAMRKRVGRWSPGSLVVAVVVACRRAGLEEIRHWRLERREGGRVDQVKSELVLC